jgi:hypothetical protein
VRPVVSQRLAATASLALLFCAARLDIVKIGPDMRLNPTSSFFPIIIGTNHFVVSHHCIYEYSMTLRPLIVISSLNLGLNPFPLLKSLIAIQEPKRHGI